MPNFVTFMKGIAKFGMFGGVCFLQSFFLKKNITQCNQNSKVASPGQKSFDIRLQKTFDAPEGVCADVGLPNHILEVAERLDGGIQSQGQEDGSE